jgi:hypothetical protein
MKLNEAIEYLRSKNKYILDPKCKFKPTSSAHTNVRETILKAKMQQSLSTPNVKKLRGING